MTASGFLFVVGDLLSRLRTVLDSPSPDIQAARAMLGIAEDVAAGKITTDAAMDQLAHLETQIRKNDSAADAELAAKFRSSPK